MRLGGSSKSDEHDKLITTIQGQRVNMGASKSRMS